ncbi:MAG: serine--tRNA ligase [Patescibacteria group bacterium UBA2163]
MLDIKFIEENPDIVRAAIQNKKSPAVDLDALLALNEKRKTLQKEIDDLNRAKNEAATARDIDRGKQVKEELQTVTAEYSDVEKEYATLLLKIPNIPSADTPIGADESENKVLSQVGEQPSFSFTPKPHWELGEHLDVIDTKKAADVSGARFNYLKGAAAMLQYALFDLGVKVLTDSEVLEGIAERAGLAIKVTPFIPVVPPLMMRSAVMNRMARLHPLDERYYLEKDDLVLIGSAEHTLGPIHMDEKIKEEDVPLRYFAFTPAFRREAGSYGKDTRGVIRQHQFDKLEMETFVRPEDGYPEQDFIVAIQEHVLQLLELPYQKVAICTGDMGAPDHRQFDMETWMPGQGVYKETHTSDYMGGYQARRLRTRLVRKDGSTEAVHMNDATLFAMGRMIAAIMENYQQEDGSIRVPKVLQQYVGKDIIKA